MNKLDKIYQAFEVARQVALLTGKAAAKKPGVVAAGVLLADILEQPESLRADCPDDGVTYRVRATLPDGEQYDAHDGTICTYFYALKLARRHAEKYPRRRVSITPVVELRHQEQVIQNAKP